MALSAKGLLVAMTDLQEVGLQIISGAQQLILRVPLQVSGEERIAMVQTDPHGERPAIRARTVGRLASARIEYFHQRSSQVDADAAAREDDRDPLRLRQPQQPLH